MEAGPSEGQREERREPERRTDAGCHSEDPHPGTSAPRTWGQLLNQTGLRFPHLERGIIRVPTSEDVEPFSLSKRKLPKLLRRIGVAFFKDAASSY